MLKINLLPAYIHQRKQVRLAIGVVVVLVAAEVAGLIFMRNGPLKARDDLNNTLQQKQAKLSELQKLGTDANAVLAEEAALAPKYDFLIGMQQYNRKYPALYERTAAYTYYDAMTLAMEATPNSMTVTAYVSNPTDASRLLQGLSRIPDFEGLPTLSGVPGFDAAQEEQRQQVQEGLPSDSLIIGGAGMPGADAGAGMAGGPVMPGGAGNGPGAPMGMGAGSEGMSPSSSGMMAGGAGNGPGGAPGGMPGGAGGQAGGDLGALPIGQARQKPKGFVVKVSAALRKQITRPSYFDSDAQAGGTGGGAGGGMPGMPGMPGGAGMPGMPGNGA